jgi:proton glutamate symport protein
VNCWLIRVPFLRLFKVIREQFTIAFTTASSEAALPSAMESMERFGCPREIVGFVLPTGYCFNLAGTALYLSLASIFIAPVFNVPMHFKTQLMMMLTLMLTSKGGQACRVLPWWSWLAPLPGSIFPWRASTRSRDQW